MYKCKDWSEESNGEQWKTVYDIVLCRQTFEFFALWVNIWKSKKILQFIEELAINECTAHYVLC